MWNRKSPHCSQISSCTSRQTVFPEPLNFSAMSPFILYLTLFWSSGAVTGCWAVNSYFCLWKCPSAQILEVDANFLHPHDCQVISCQVSAPTGSSSHIQRKGRDRSGFVVPCEDEGGHGLGLPAPTVRALVLPKRIMWNSAQQRHSLYLTVASPSYSHQQSRNPRVE